jgi:acetyl esterase/lipase
MSSNLDLIHPELRAAGNFIPRFSFNRWNLPLMRLATKLAPLTKTSTDLSIENAHIPSQGKKIRVRIYKAKTAVTPMPGLVWIHGGGFIIGTPEMDDAFMIQLVQELGIAVVSVDYRLAPEHPFPTPLEDCYCALKWTHAQAQMLGIDPDRIAIGEESAGGGLAASLAQLAVDHCEVSPIFQLLVYPMLDDRTVICPGIENQECMTWSQESNRFGWESYLNQKCGAEAVPPYAAAARREDLRGLPPAWIGVGTLDLFYQENAVYAQRLKESGVACEFVTVPGAFHGFDVAGTRLQVVRDFRNSQIAALKRYLFPDL